MMAGPKHHIIHFGRRVTRYAENGCRLPCRSNYLGPAKQDPRVDDLIMGGRPFRPDAKLAQIDKYQPTW